MDKYQFNAMIITRKKLLSTLFLSLSCSAFTLNASGQCVTIANLPDTIEVCKLSQVTLNPIVVSPGLLQTTDTTWMPAAGLSDPNIINPVATLGTTSQTYKLTIEALTPFNFVNNGDFSSGNTGFTSGYTLGTGGAWGQLSDEGTFAVTTNPSLVHINFASFGDHTTGTGQMMVINGSATAGVNVWCQTIPVTPNTDYDFSAWSASCVVSNPAILQFAINGVLLGAPHNLPATTGTWTQFHAVWNSGTNTTATICITNQNIMPSGNDFALDDIEFREFCTAEDSVYIKVINMAPSINFTPHLGCEFDVIAFEAIDNGDTADQYIWDFGDGNGSLDQNPNHTYTTQGIYNVKLITRKNGCEDSAMVTVNTLHPLSIDFKASDDSICIGEPITFTSNSTATTPITYFWDFGDGNTGAGATITHTYANPGIYTVMHVISDAIPCYDTMYTTIFVEFTPYTSLTANDSLICVGETILFESEASPGYTSITWDFDDRTILPNDVRKISHSYDEPGDYTVTFTVTYPQCPDAVKTKDIRVFPVPHVDIGEDTSLCPHSLEPIILTNLQPRNPGELYQWNTGSTDNFIRVAHPGIYALTVTNDNGCSAADSIEVFKNCYLDVPNAFTPNGDNINDYFLPRQLLSRGITKFDMKIFNRWGQLVFETNTLQGRGWDGKFNGKEQPNGVYIYLIELELQGKYVEKYQGNVTLLR